PPLVRFNDRLVGFVPFRASSQLLLDRDVLEGAQGSQTSLRSEDTDILLGLVVAHLQRSLGSIVASLILDRSRITPTDVRHRIPSLLLGILLVDLVLASLNASKEGLEGIRSIVIDQTELLLQIVLLRIEGIFQTAPQKPALILLS